MAVSSIAMHAEGCLSRRTSVAKASAAVLSLFSGAGGLDLGFEDAGFDVDLALDLRRDSITSYNQNRSEPSRGMVQDVRYITPERLDALASRVLRPTGVIGGPPCQSFSRATSNSDSDPRHDLPLHFVRLVRELNRRHPVQFFTFENVPGLLRPRHAGRFASIVDAFGHAGFRVFSTVLNARDFGVPQNRPRLILVGLNRDLFPSTDWVAPAPARAAPRTVRETIGGFPEPTLWRRGMVAADVAFHPNHWCMVPKSRVFGDAGALVPGTARGRSFRTLEWDRPSPTVAYGNREVHVHPSCRRRLSVHEAMRLQGFPSRYVLYGSLSSQITQVSEAVPPPLAQAVAESIAAAMAQGGATVPAMPRAA